jgi:GNAT superfamily N-acetyltransferase
MPSGYLSRLDAQARAERWRRTIVEGGSDATTLIALVDDRVAGFTSYGPPRDSVGDGWGELWALNIHPDFWRHGIGTALFSAASTGLVGLGYSHAYLWVLKGNERAIAFYRRQGWQPDGEVKIDDQRDFTPPLVELRCSTALG